MSSKHQAAAERIVSNPILELRRRPDHRSEVVSEALLGSRLRVLAEHDEGRWLRVLAPDGYRAWARSWGTVADDPAWPRSGLFVTATATTLHTQPASKAPVVMTVTMGGRLGLLRSQARGLRRVATPDGRIGWIAAGAVAADSVPAAARFWTPASKRALRPKPADFLRGSPRSLLSRARSLLGVAYRWGGVSPLGMDCSGFTRLLFGLEGVGLPRDARDQAESMRAFWVSPDAADLKRGDLVFFRSPGGAIDHVGIGIGGRAGRIIHASGRVRISALVPGDRLFEDPLAARMAIVARPSWGSRRLVAA
jgi:cell wall-associated NlpC family hydrolase